MQAFLYLVAHTSFVVLGVGCDTPVPVPKKRDLIWLNNSADVRRRAYLRNATPQHLQLPRIRPSAGIILKVLSQHPLRVLLRVAKSMLNPDIRH